MSVVETTGLISPPLDDGSTGPTVKYDNRMQPGVSGRGREASFVDYDGLRSVVVSVMRDCEALGRQCR